MMLIMYDWECEHCGHSFESMEEPDMNILSCPKCSHNSFKTMPKKAPNFNLTYNPKSDMCDWDGNTSQYYRLYNEAKGRGEDVRLPEEGEK